MFDCVMVRLLRNISSLKTDLKFQDLECFRLNKLDPQKCTKISKRFCFDR